LVPLGFWENIEHGYVLWGGSPPNNLGYWLSKNRKDRLKHGYVFNLLVF